VEYYISILAMKSPIQLINTFFKRNKLKEIQKEELPEWIKVTITDGGFTTNFYNKRDKDIPNFHELARLNLIASIHAVAGQEKQERLKNEH